MAFGKDRSVIKETLSRDPAFARIDLTRALSELGSARSVDAFLMDAMRVMARAGNGHSRVIPNAAIQVWPVGIVARSFGFGVVQGDATVPLKTVNDAPVEDMLNRFRPMLAGTPARQSVIGAVLLAWPAALGAQTVTYGLEDRTLCLDQQALVPALPLYPTSDTGAANPGLDSEMGSAHLVWDDQVWHMRIARLDVPLPPGLVETVLTRPKANIVVDLRGNTGGSFLPMMSVIDALRSSWQGTRIAVQVDRFTFSAAIVTAVLLQYHLGARLFGENMGDGLRFWAEGSTTALPDSGANLRWSSAWHDWETGRADATTPPEIAHHMVATGPLQITECADGTAARNWAAG